MSNPPIPFEPENALETAILCTQEGKFPIARLLNAIMGSELFVPSRSEVQQDGSGFQPLLTGPQDAPMICAFSAPGRTHAHKEIAPFILRVRGIGFFQWVPANYGVALNPGSAAMLTIPADGVAGIKKDLEQQQAAAPQPPN